MKLRTLRLLTDIVIVLVLLDFVMGAAAAISSTVWGFLASVTYFVFYRAARQLLLRESEKPPTFMFYFLWYAPTVIIVVAPMLWSFYQGPEQSAIEFLLFTLPWLSLILPVTLLAVIRHELHIRS